MTEGTKSNYRSQINTISEMVDLFTYLERNLISIADLCDGNTVQSYPDLLEDLSVFYRDTYFKSAEFIRKLSAIKDRFVEKLEDAK